MLLYTEMVKILFYRHSNNTEGSNNMAKYNVHAGHCPQISGAAFGATGLLKESVEDRLVKDEVIRLLRKKGHTVYDTTCDDVTTAGECLARIVKKCNAHKVDLDISIHLNSGRNDYIGDNSTGGTEVWNYDSRTKEISDRICHRISDELSIRNRGTMYNKNLYVLKNTNSPAILIECCFVDDRDDQVRWNPKKCAKAIVDGILNENVNKEPDEFVPLPVPTPSPKPGTSTLENLGKVNVTYRVQIAGGKWLDPVTNMNNKDHNGYAGIDKRAIGAISIKTDKGAVKYRCHVKKYGWLPYATGYDVKDFHNGYAGDGREIDAIELYFVTPKGYGFQQARYRVSPTDTSKYYGYQIDDFKHDGMDGYAGEFGHAIDKIQIYIQ